MNDEIIQELNRRIAKMLGFEPKQVRVEFLPLIERKERFKDGQIESFEVKGRCIVNEGRIQLVVDRNWGVTLIHELIHLYQPEMRHPKVKQLTKQCVLYLKTQVADLT